MKLHPLSSPSLDTGLILQQYNLTTSTYSSNMGRYYFSVSTHCIGIISFFILTIIMTILLIRKWKDMIPFKRFFYISIIYTAILQIISQGFACAHDIGSLTDMKEYLTQLFFIIYYCGLISTVAMCTFLQGMVTKVLYGIYFHNSHSWMRKGSDKFSLNEKLRIFTKYYSIGMVITWIIVIIILVPFTLVCSMVYYMDGTDATVGKILGIWSVVSVAIVGLVNSACSIFTGVLNFALVILLTRNLLHNVKVTSIPRRNACKKLLLLTFGQFYMALINSISIILGGIGIWVPTLFILTGVIHRFVFLLFAICVSFSFGPMDYFNVELKLDDKKQNIPIEDFQSSNQTHEDSLKKLDFSNQQATISFNIDSKAARKANEQAPSISFKSISLQPTTQSPFQTNHHENATQNNMLGSGTDDVFVDVPLN